MAWSPATSRGTTGNEVSSTMVAMSPSEAIAVGKIALVWCASDNIATADGASSNHSISDTDGHVWTKLKEWTRSAGAAADGVTISLYAVKVTTEIGTADTVTITFTSAVVAKAMGIGEATVAAGQTFELEPSSDVGNQGTSDIPSAANSGLVSQEYLFFGLEGHESQVVTTEDADYTTLNTVTSGGTGATAVRGHAATRIATLTGDTYGPTLGASRDWACVIVALDEIAAGGAGIATPATVAAVAAVPAPTARGAARTTPATVGAVAAVPAPTARGAARTTPATVAAVAAVPAPTARGAARTTPATVATIAAVPPPSSVGGTAIRMGDYDQRAVTPDLVSVASGSEIGTAARGSE